MKKWQGMMLSDHTAATNDCICKPHKQIAVQLKDLDIEGNIQSDIVEFSKDIILMRL